MAFYNGREVSIPDFNPMAISSQTISFVYPDGAYGSAKMSDVTFTKDEKQKFRDAQDGQFDSLKEISDKEVKSYQADQKRAKGELAQANAS